MPALSDQEVDWRAEVLLSGGVNGDEKRCGFIPLVVKDPNWVRETKAPSGKLTPESHDEEA